MNSIHRALGKSQFTLSIRFFSQVPRWAPSKCGQVTRLVSRVAIILGIMKTLQVIPKKETQSTSCQVNPVCYSKLCWKATWLHVYVLLSFPENSDKVRPERSLYSKTSLRHSVVLFSSANAKHENQRSNISENQTSTGSSPVDALGTSLENNLAKRLPRTKNCRERMKTEGI